MLVAVKNIHAREDVPGRTVPEVKDGQQRMLPVFIPGTGAEIPAATVERVTLMAFKGKLDAAFVQNILERRIDVVCERCPVTDVIEGFLRGGRFALAGFGISLGIIQENLRVADVTPGNGRIQGRVEGSQELPEAEAAIPVRGLFLRNIQERGQL